MSIQKERLVFTLTGERLNVDYNYNDGIRRRQRYVGESMDACHAQKREARRKCYQRKSVALRTVVWRIATPCKPDDGLCLFNCALLSSSSIRHIPFTNSSRLRLPDVVPSHSCLCQLRKHTQGH